MDHLWDGQTDSRGDLIKAGDRLYAGGDGVLTAIDLSAPIGKPSVAWRKGIRKVVGVVKTEVRAS
jgi:hypothetical protein